MASFKRVWWRAVAAAVLVMGPAAQAQQMDPSPPASPVKLVFLHHSTGENWLRDAQPGDDTAGGLGAALAQNNYFVSDTNYGWGPYSIGDRTDIGNWWEWFRGDASAEILAAVYAQNSQNCSYTRLGSDPGGTNEIILFKSCFPNSNLGGSPSDPVPPIGENPLRGQDSGSEHHTIANAKGIYLDLLNTFAAQPDKLFVIICAPPLRPADTGPEQAANARAFNDWLVEHLLDDYSGNNVAVFDFYTVLTSNGGNPNVNDLGASTGNHHRWRDGQIEHVRGLASDTSAYPSGDSHPSAAGGAKATGEFPALLNIAYHCWKGTGGCLRTAVCTVSCSATVPTRAAPVTPVSFTGNATPSSICTDTLVYDWDFGDGSAHSEEQSPSHTYAQEGIYTWTFTASSGTAACTQSGTVRIAQPEPPVVTGVQKLGSPFRLRITGSHFEDGITVTLGTDIQPWSNTQRKSDTQIMLKGGGSLKARFPKGQTVTIYVHNPDGGTASISYTR